ncbi:SDR family NAD(P)-dependent oxidoreductase [Dictyobacter kobayashii]|uniref:Short-chain dehydrogenase n=1 Tax=Dictyobacter kobayashii TaxID=2014872 RepID=A0A402ASQ1_9CHLR|nr:SDR family oxidoreductase [Dictyobacter kobayashii]GCE22111.1 short-chain dehydrogenase [Dictyobacter kobayashii]
MLLEKKNAVIYGAGGAIGGAVARAFAREGARVFLTGRRLASVDALAREILDGGGVAEAAQVDALDELAIEKHLSTVTEKAGSIDISINTIGLPPQRVQGMPLIEMPAERFALPITTLTQTHFLTARAAARHMVEKRSGVIVTLSATASRLPVPGLGAMSSTWAAIEALTRSLAVELGPQGIRVICLQSNAIPETATIQETYGRVAETLGITREQVVAQQSATAPLRRLPTLVEVANVAAFMASDQASAMTATAVNLSCGILAD